MNILMSNVLDENQINEIKELQSRCNNADGLKSDAFLSNELNFRKDVACFYLGYKDERLVSFLTTFMPTSSEAEIIAFTDTNYRRQGYFTILLDEAIGTIKEISIPKILFAVESNSSAGVNVIERYSSAKWNHSEYNLICESKDKIPSNGELYERVVDSESKDVYVGLVQRIFNMPRGEYENFVQHTIDSNNREAFIVFCSDTPIGIFNINYKDNISFVYCLGVESYYRGQGYGKKLLGIALDIGFKYGEKIVLDVDSDNMPAYNLYTSNGFKVEYQIDYYTYDI